jgi:hypothetical protein
MFGDIVAIIQVLEFPTKESFNTCLGRMISDLRSKSKLHLLLNKKLFFEYNILALIYSDEKVYAFYLDPKLGCILLKPTSFC